MALSAFPYVLIRNICHDTAVGTCDCCTTMWNRRSWQFNTATLSAVSADMPFLCCIEELLYLDSIVEVMRYFEKKPFFHDGLWVLAISISWDH